MFIICLSPGKVNRMPLFFRSRPQKKGLSHKRGSPKIVKNNGSRHLKRVGCRLMIEDKNRTVAELLETAKEKLWSLIQYLCALDVTRSKDGVFFASNAMEGSSHKVCAVLSMRNEILECELPQNYAWDFTPWEELMGYGLAETKLTKDHANTVLAQILYDMMFFGMDHETWKREAAEIEESLGVSRKAVEAGEYRTAEEVFAEFGLPKDEPDEVADELSSKIMQAEIEYNQHCRKREAAKVRMLLENN